MNWHFVLIFLFLNTNNISTNDVDKFNKILNYKTNTQRGQAISQATKMANLIDQIAEFWNMTSVYIIYNSKIQDNNLLRDFLSKLHQKGDSYLHGLPHLSLRERDTASPLYDIADMGHKDMVLTIMHSVYDTVLMATANITRYHRSCFTIYFLQGISNPKDLHYLFGQLWKYQLRRPLVIGNGQHLFTMHPYPELKIVNVTLEPMATWFPIADGIKDFKGYTVHMPVQIDIPSTYFYRDEKTREYKADGSAAWIINELMSRVNVTLKVYPLKFNHSYVVRPLRHFELLRSGEIELSPQLLTVLRKENDVDFSYPFVSTSRCIMMPRPRKVTIGFYRFITWKLYAFLGVFMVLYEVLWKFYPRYCRRVNRGYSWLHYRPFYAIGVLFGIPIPQLPLPSFVHLRSFAFLRLLIAYFIIAFSGNCISQMFSCHFTSLLTASYVKGAANIQLEDIFSARIPIMTRAYDVELFAKLYKIDDFDRDKIRTTSYEDIQAHRSQLNSSFMYLVTKEEYVFLEQQQRYLHPKLFRLTNICHGPYTLQFPLRADSHFLELFYFFILRLRESGIYEHHKRSLFQRAKSHGQSDYLQEGDIKGTSELDITFNTLRAMMFVLSVGYSSSIVVFILELYGKRIVCWLRGFKF